MIKHRKWGGPLTGYWKPLFTWWPVKVQGKWVWLKTIERRWVEDETPGGDVDWEYRL